MGYEVFVSYSTDDKAAAVKVVDHLEAQGIKSWYSARDVRPGSKYFASIMAAISECIVAVFLVSSKSIGSRHVETELERCFHGNKIIIPVRIEDIELTEEWTYFMSTSQWVDAFPPNDEQMALNELASAVREHMKKNQVQATGLMGVEITSPVSPVVSPVDAPQQQPTDRGDQLQKETPAPEGIEKPSSNSVTQGLDSYKGILFDTNRSYDNPPDYSDSFKLMVEKNRVSAFGGSKDAVRRLSKGDIVFYSHKWVGIVGAARVIGDAVASEGDELHWDVEFLTQKPKDYANPPGMTFQRVKEVTGKNFFWARILKVPYLKKEEVDHLVKELQALLGPA